MNRILLKRFPFALIYILSIICGLVQLPQISPNKLKPTQTPYKLPVFTTPIKMGLAFPMPSLTPTATFVKSDNLDKLFYTVKTGDTLSKISLLTGIPIDSLVVLNDIKNPNYIQVGQSLSLKTNKETLDKAINEPGKKIIVILSEQKVYVYDGDKLVKTFLASTGVLAHPTVTGRYEIWIKLESTTMSGGEGKEKYTLPNVPWTMYFYKDYGIHGTYWHHDFGHPMSHGCVNLSIPDAKWLFDWASIGTPVWVIP